MAGIEVSIVEFLLREMVGPAAFPTAACVVLWFRMQKGDEARSKEIDKYLSVIENNSRVIGENTSALNRVAR